MEKLKFEKPCVKRKIDAFDYIKEFNDYNSDLNGVGGLNRYLADFDGWLKKLEDDRTRVANEEKVPAETFFLVRVSDNRIVGMVNIRLALNERLEKFGGNIGYCIRPTERRKGYNKINLYLALLCCQEHGVSEVLMDCDKDNAASSKTIKALGGKLIREYFEDKNVHCIVEDYKIDVENSIKEYSKVYETKIARSENGRFFCEFEEKSDKQI